MFLAKALRTEQSRDHLKPTPRTHYHFRLLFLYCEETFPPANNSATRLDQVAANFMKSLLLFCSPFFFFLNEEKKDRNKNPSFHLSIFFFLNVSYYFPAERKVVQYLPWHLPHFVLCPIFNWALCLSNQLRKNHPYSKQESTAFNYSIPMCIPLVH